MPFCNHLDYVFQKKFLKICLFIVQTLKGSEHLLFLPFLLKYTHMPLGGEDVTLVTDEGKTM